jgi:pilus assembly protein FimV
MLLPGAGALIALLAGLGIYRLRNRRKAGGETSFLESRLQPDSFFGATGGQRIDTHEGSTGASAAASSSYSLSQLDAIGDVDPVAEADVYLAYGRDLQAEEILKEAMRANPDRMAIRIKLLEVYAKRRDAKGFELLATQVHSLTRGQGEDWAKAQQLGLSIDPDNPLYRPGAQPEAVQGSEGRPVEVLSASTLPYTAPMAPPAFQPQSGASLDGGPDSGIDLVLDLGETPAAGPATASESALDFQLDGPPAAPPVPPAPQPAAAGIDFDLAGLDSDSDTRKTAPVPPVSRASQFGDLTIGGESIPAAPPDEADPLARKLELAEEFRHIGDLEGARDLLEEVVAKADGALRSKAQSMLDGLD